MYTHCTYNYITKYTKYWVTCISVISIASLDEKMKDMLGHVIMSVIWET